MKEVKLKIILAFKIQNLNNLKPLPTKCRDKSSLPHLPLYSKLFSSGIGPDARVEGAISGLKHLVFIHRGQASDHWLAGEWNGEVEHWRVMTSIVPDLCEALGPTGLLR